LISPGGLFGGQEHCRTDLIPKFHQHYFKVNQTTSISSIKSAILEFTLLIIGKIILIVGVTKLRKEPIALRG